MESDSSHIMQPVHELVYVNIAFAKVEHLSTNFVIGNRAKYNVEIVYVFVGIRISIGKYELCSIP